MWLVISEEDMRCRECSHVIRTGSKCLSQVPVDVPEGFRRGRYENFCIDCPLCKSAKTGCYERRLSHWYIPARTTKEAVSCGQCNATIPRNTYTVAQNFYAWPDSEDGKEEDSRTTAQGMAGVSAASGNAARNSTGPVPFDKLSPDLRRRFISGGLGGNRGARTMSEAARFYEESVPMSVRAQGQSSIKSFLRGKQASHVESVASTPLKAKAPGNVIWEDKAKNLSRGGRNMTAAEQAAAKSAIQSSRNNIILKAAAKGAAKGGAVAIATEAPVAGLENFLHWKRGRKSGAQAAKDTAKSTALAGTGVGAVGATMTFVPLSLGPAGVPLAVAGGVFWAGVTVHRLVKAGKRDLPLNEYYIYFCKGKDCKTAFARAMTDLAKEHETPDSPEK